MEKFTGDVRKTTLHEAIDWLEERMEEGVECPCCCQLAKVYKRKLNSAMAFVLILLHQREGDKEAWVHVPSYINAQVLDPAVSAAIRGDWAKLVHWGFIEAMDGVRADGSKRMGYYRITRQGRLFASGRITAPKHLWFYNGVPVDTDADTVSIIEALGEKFDYSELMRA